ncbi:phenol hydroxylase subunit [Castellaniella defragrans]|uniref:phenol hydroxylase subunit n=1 Tax=Castellaniella defragrans TaxID=75697 RepID=UPI000A06B631|nr:phenol hydroxylase subunit [Castellaniella defragrans]
MQTTPVSIDVTRKYVRLLRRRPDGFVEFEFALGEPDLYVEMILPAPAYASFCAINAPEELPPRTGHDESGLGLSLSQAVERLRSPSHPSSKEANQ